MEVEKGGETKAGEPGRAGVYGPDWCANPMFTLELGTVAH